MKEGRNYILSIRRSAYLYGGGGVKAFGQKLGIEVIIETQGGAGVENQLKQKDIDEAACVVLVNDVALEGLDRFKGKKVLKMGVSDLIKKSDAVMKRFRTHSSKSVCRGSRI